MPFMYFSRTLFSPSLESSSNLLFGFLNGMFKDNLLSISVQEDANQGETASKHLLSTMAVVKLKLAYLYADTGRYAEAEALHKEVMASRET